MPTPFIYRRCTARLTKPTCTSIRQNKPLFHTGASQVSPTERPSQPAISTASTQDGQFKIRKHVSVPKPDAQKLDQSPLAKSTRELRTKIFASRRDYGAVLQDLGALYGLTPLEAQHAANQLTRLLWANVGSATISSRLDRYLAWKEKFAILLRNTVVSPVQESSSFITSQGGPETIPDETEATSLMSAWQRMNKYARQRQWPRMILSALESRPRSLPTLIEATFNPSLCPSYIVEDMLYLLYNRHQLALNTVSKDDCGAIRQEMETIVAFMLKRCPPRYLALGQPIVQLVSSSMPLSELVQYYQQLTAIQHPLHPNTLLHLASRLAKRSDTKVYAAGILRILSDQPGFDLNTPAAASVCTSLLTLNKYEPLPSDEQAAPDILFEFLLKRGLQPNILGLSALMRNFCIRGHLDTAWKVLDLMVQHGIKLDPHVYSILFHGSKRNLDSASLVQIFNLITSHNAWSPYLVNDFLGLLFRENESQRERRRRQRKKLNNAWRPMLELYAKFFHLGPLQKLTRFPLENMLGGWGVREEYATLSTKLAESLKARPYNKLMQPDSITLCLMVGAHMRSLLTQWHAIRYYKHFFKLVHKKDPTALNILANQRTLMSDIFFRTLMQFRATVGFALRGVEKMIKNAKVEKAQLGHNLYYHPPSSYTWTIIINGLKNHKATRGIINVLNMMSSLGYQQPSLPAWNAVVQAFARAHDARGVIRAIWSLEHAGFQPDDRTIKAVQMLPRVLKEQVAGKLQDIRNNPEKYTNVKSLFRGPGAKSNGPKIGQIHHVPLGISTPGSFPAIIPLTRNQVESQQGGFVRRVWVAQRRSLKPQ